MNTEQDLRSSSRTDRPEEKQHLFARLRLKEAAAALATGLFVAGWVNACKGMAFIAGEDGELQLRDIDEKMLILVAAAVLAGIAFIIDPEKISR